MKGFFVLVRVLLLSWLLMASALARAFSSPATASRNSVRPRQQWTRQSQPSPTDGLGDSNDNAMSTLTTRGGTGTNAVVTSRRGRKLLQSGVVGGSSIGASSLGSIYARWLERRPLVTKSVTASLIFGLSDYLAQVLERSSTKSSNNISISRIVWSMAVGLLYFGPAAHYWYETIFRLLPGTSLWSTFQKAVLGQLIFGPSFTCIFFAVSLIQSGQWSVAAWFRKIAQDFPKAWLAGAGFWPLMDLISYSFISKEWIPLFINGCSLVWTIYLSLIANRRQT